MTASEFERFHGVALARLLTATPGRALKAAEMIPAEGWSALVPVKGPAVVIRHRPRARRMRSTPGARVWRFTFTSEQVARLRRLRQNRRLQLLLVCGGAGSGPAEMALLEPMEVARLLDLSSFLDQRLMVQARPRKELWVSRNKVQVKVPRARFPARSVS